ncbi:hypothetical protein VNO78_03879 [Psophocarpus tetragonolobus]|uniref:Uncharacterized protein n=1 Tax=Psophocarpus tetragonolobus TaxID=3891 RepID=A0AAN9T2Z1_PSOTE
MCSNTCTSACGGGCGTGGNIVSSIWSSSLKKQPKRPRVPKRGPGVAELEKILREQETIDINDKGNTEGFSSFISHHSNSIPYPSSSLKFHPSQKIPIPSSPILSNLPTNVPPVPNFDHHLGPIHGNCGSLDRSTRSALVSPEKELFPLNLNSSSKSKLNMKEPIDANQHDSANSPLRNLSNESNSIWPYSATIQKRNNQYSPSTVAGMKRPRIALENSLIPPSNFHVLPSFSHYNRSHQSSMNDSHGASSFNSTKECCRDAKWGNTLELSNTRFNFNNDMAVPGHTNLPPFVTPEIPSPPMHLFLSKGNVIPTQISEDKMEAHQDSQSSELNRRPFYNFLQVEDPEVTETMHGANRGGREAGKIGIDLNLKL